MIGLAIALLLVRPTLVPEETAPDWLEDLRRVAAERLLVVAHRGDSARCPENTLSALRGALACRADLVEIDVRADRTGRLVCLHDETLDRTTNAEEVFGRRGVRIDEVGPEELAGIDAGSWKHRAFAGERIPTLAEALDLLAGRSVALVERKSGDAEAFVAALRDARGPAILQAFDWDFLERVRRLDGRLPLVALGSGELTTDDLERLERLGVVGLHWRAADLDVEELLVAKKRGWLVWVYTVDDDLCAAGAAALGVDGVTTNDPARLVGRVVEGWAARRGGGPARRGSESGRRSPAGGG